MITYEEALAIAKKHRDGIAVELTEMCAYEMPEDWAFQLEVPSKDGHIVVANPLCFLVSKESGEVRMSCCPSDEWFEVWEKGKELYKVHA